MPIRFRKQSAGTIATPAPNYVSFFIDSTTGLPRLKTDNGSITDLGSSGGGGEPSAPAETISSVATSTVTAALHSVQRVNVSSGAVTVNLPSEHAAGDKLTVKLVSLATNPCTIEPAGTDTIDGDDTLVLTSDFEWATLISDGSNWMQIS